jgi:TM2 domain-containing membrane protein YozV
MDQPGSSRASAVTAAQVDASSASNAAHSMMMFEANKRSMGISYLLWFFLGGFGGHRFYNGKTGSAIAQLVLTLIGIVLSLIAIGVLILLPVAIWVLVDAFLIPGWVRDYNNRLIARISR